LDIYKDSSLSKLNTYIKNKRMNHISSLEDLNWAIAESEKAFQLYRLLGLGRRVEFMHTIAQEIEALGDQLLETTSRETNLPLPRLRNERQRTMYQLTSYADALAKGLGLEIRINTAIIEGAAPQPDLRKMRLPLGPVVVFGASNFPFAYSTAGGDTACAFAAGCSVIVKAHEAHEETSKLMAEAIWTAAEKCGLPKSIFTHVVIRGHQVGEQLVKNEMVKAVGFTGSVGAGLALQTYGQSRKTPIPVFAEMGSVNPVFVLPEKLLASPEEVATNLVGAITLGVGQFCTKPGVIVAIKSPALNSCIEYFKEKIATVQAAAMLHTGIFANYEKQKAKMLDIAEINVLAGAEANDSERVAPLITTILAKNFLDNPKAHEEVFGPYSLVVQCESIEEMEAVASSFEGQLTVTIIGTEAELQIQSTLVNSLKDICGRLIYNGVPTGVAVVDAMHHGGPYPSTTDGRFSAVGADGILRFNRPVSFQNCPPQQLPEELHDANPLNLWRLVNGNYSREEIKPTT